MTAATILCYAMLCIAARAWKHLADILFIPFFVDFYK